MRPRWLQTFSVAALAALLFGGGQAVSQTPVPSGSTDLSGVWLSTNKKVVTDLSGAGQMPAMRPWADALYKERLRTGGKDRPSQCLPRGLPGDMLVPNAPWKIVQAPGAIVVLFGSLHYRQIFTDGRELPREIELPAWLGYSIGRWEGDTLVVQTIGFTEETWLDDRGHPHSSDMRLTERFRRTSAKRLEVQVTIDDVKAYVRPWTMTFSFELRPESDLTERVCAPPPMPVRVASAGRAHRLQVEELDQEKLAPLLRLK